MTIPSPPAAPAVLSSLLLALPVVVAAGWPAGRLPAQAPDFVPGEVFERVVDTLQRRYWDREFRRNELPGLAAKFRAAAEQAGSLAEEGAVVDGLLAHVPSSHLALYSRATYETMFAELTGRPRVTFGFQVKQRAGRFFACKILEDGPAARAGLLRGDRVVAIEGVPPGRSPRLDRSSDDAYLPDAPLHGLLVEPDPDAAADPELELLVERRPGERQRIVVTAAKYSALQAAAASARVIEQGGRRIGYVHLWYVHAGCVRLLRQLAEERFAGVDALVLDLRGRGGSAAEAKGIVEFFTGPRRTFKQPFAVLMDRESRSAKEMLAYEFHKRKAAPIIGERSAGALVPASFARVGPGLMLMFPAGRLGEYSNAVELNGIEPDIPVENPLPYTAGADPILERALEHLAR